MAQPDSDVTLTRDQVAQLRRQLGDLRHNVNNHLALVVAALDLIVRKPDSAARMVTNISAQPPKILEEVRRFSDEFNRVLGPGPKPGA